MIQLLDPQNNLIKAIFYRKHCMIVQGQICIKDLGLFNIDPQNIIIVDNTPSCFLANIDNGIPITSFIDNQCDNELNNLIDFLTD